MWLKFLTFIQWQIYRGPQDHQEILEHLEWTEVVENMVKGDLKLVINVKIWWHVTHHKLPHVALYKHYQNTKHPPNPICILYKGYN